MAHSLFLTHWYPTESRPVNGTFIREHALAVSAYDKVTLIHIEGVNQANPTVSREQDETLTVYRLRYSKPSLPKTGWLTRLRGVHQIFNSLIQTGDRPDIIHAHIFSSADLAYLLSRRYHLPAVLTEQASSYPRDLFTRTQAITIRFFMNRLQLIMPVSEELRRHMQRYGIRGPYQIIPNTVDTGQFHPPNILPSPETKPKRILMVAMLYPVKGINFLLQGIQRVIEHEKNIELWIVGDGPERNNLETLTAQLGIGDKVSFLGVKSKVEIADLMRQASMFALTSNWDNLPSVLVEAMACGLPIVASAIGGIPEIVKPFCGRLSEPGNPASIADCIDYVLFHPDEFPREQIARYAHDEFSRPVVGKKISAAYQRVLESYRR